MVPSTMQQGARTREEEEGEEGLRGLVALKCESPRSSAPALTATTIAMETWRHIIRCATNYIHMHAHSHTHTGTLACTGVCVSVCVYTGAWHVKKSRERLKSEGKYFCFSLPSSLALSPSPPALCAAAATSRVVAKLFPFSFTSPSPCPIARCQLRCK